MRVTMTVVIGIPPLLALRFADGLRQHREQGGKHVQHSGNIDIHGSLLAYAARLSAVSSMVESAWGRSSISWMTADLCFPSRPVMLLLRKETP